MTDYDPDEIPTILTLASELVGLPVHDIVEAIRLTLTTRPEKPTAAELDQIYEAWINPIAEPVARELGQSRVVTAYALVAAVQQLPKAKP
jgi:hypothetical protein